MTRQASGTAHSPQADLAAPRGAGAPTLHFESLKKRKGRQLVASWRKMCPSERPRPCPPRGHQLPSRQLTVPFSDTSVWGGDERQGCRAARAYLGDEVEGEEQTTANVNVQKGAGENTTQKSGSRPVRKRSTPATRPTLRGLQSDGPLVTGFALGNSPSPLLCPCSWLPAPTPYPPTPSLKV